MISATERLYFTDSHLTEFTARVAEVTSLGEGRAAVKLDRTAFYPTGGGQPTDTGTLDGARVVECVDQEEAGVLHIIEGPAPEMDAVVKGRVDWPRRLDHLQQHTGQHILSQAFIELFAAPTRSFRMMERASEIDVALDSPSDERIEQAVDLANRIIWENRPIRIHNVTASEAAQLPLRKDSTREGELRIIEIEGFDMTPCGGTHAKRTGEVGLMAARAWERAKGLARIEFVAGGRALADYRRANTVARSVAAIFSVGRDEAPLSVTHLLEENKQLARRARALGELAARAEANELLGETGQTNGGTRLVARVFDGRDAEDLKRLAQAIVAHPQTIALLGSRDTSEAKESGARLVFARSIDLAADMNALMRSACTELEGRGGGRPELAQGGGRHAERLAETIERAVGKLTEG